MIGWLTAGAIILVVGAIVWLVRMYTRLNDQEEAVVETRSALQKMGTALGIERYDERTLFGARVHRLSGWFNDIDVNLEVQVGSRSSYVRMTLAFPRSLGHDFRVMSPRTLGIWNWLLRLERREFEATDGQTFELFTRQNERVDQMLNSAVLFQIHRLLEKVDDLRIGDETLYISARDIPPPGELKSIVAKSLDVAERVYTTARQIGPSQAKVGASVYEEGTTGMFQRVATDTSPAVTGDFDVDTSTNPAVSSSRTQKNESV